MTDADTSYTDLIEYPHARLRFSLDTNGTPSRFFIHLEYRAVGEWMPVVHFDHNPAAPNGHDITEEGRHMDIYRDGENGEDCFWHSSEVPRYSCGSTGIDHHVSACVANYDSLRQRDS